MGSSGEDGQARRVGGSYSEHLVKRWREGPLEAMPPNILLETALRLQAEVERLRAREAALVAHGQRLYRVMSSIVDNADVYGWECPAMEQARALLASDSGEAKE